MIVDYRERTFESAIEEHLLEEGGYLSGSPGDWDRARALDPVQLFAFLDDTQPELMQKLHEHHGVRFEAALLDGLDRTLATRGLLDVLRHGAEFPATLGKTLRLAYFAPAHGINPEVQRLYDLNRLTITRQVHYSTKNEKSLDVLVSLNGLPLATGELKNPLTGQNVNHAKRQYREDRDAKEKLFDFKSRALVHFAVDPDEVYMTTRLAGEKTRFLPFNRGTSGGAGNPAVAGNFKTAYLWEDVLERHSMLDIVARFVQLQVDEQVIGGKKIRKETLIFPRYHQLDLVRKLESAARRDGPGTNYLAQHSAGSGKSNSIAWTAYRLSSLHDEQDRKIFDSVIVITDRVVLDQQLQNTIYQFEHTSGVVRRIEKSSAELAEALQDRAPIIITTLQKFPFVLGHVENLPSRHCAVIIDEAHSSQSGESAIELKRVLSGAQIEDRLAAYAEAEGIADDSEEAVLRAVLARGRQPNLSFFAFTATPKHKTLEVFGRQGPSGNPLPFHLYSMRQAIEEGFILDVLKNYTTYKTYYRLVQTAANDPNVARSRATRALARFMSLHPHNLAQKTEVMIEHFRAVTRHKIGGQAKAMVVTSSRLHAVRYKQEFDRYIRDKGYTDIRTLVAFSGTVVDENGLEYTEVQMNGGLREKELPERFASDEYQVLIVAEKYQTGFDQPRLHTMYVDKRLSGVQAVQTLSRLNRTYPGKDDTFVLDFVNDAEEIQQSFQPYYEATSIQEKADPQQLYDLQHKLTETGVFLRSEVETFARAFYSSPSALSTKALAQMNGALDPAVQRFKQLDEAEQEEFRHDISAYRNLYGFLSQVLPYADPALEKFYGFARFLLTKLPKRDSGSPIDLGDDIALEYYRLQKISEGAVTLAPGKGGTVSGPIAVGTGVVKEEAVPLSTLITRLNERFGTTFTQADQLFFDQVVEEATRDEGLMQAAQANSEENFRFPFERVLQDLFMDRMEQNQDIFTRFMTDSTFQEAVTRLMLQQVYGQLRASVVPNP